MNLGPAALLLALAASSFAWGEALDPPERIAYLGYVEGPLTFKAVGQRASFELPQRPLLPGDRLVTGRGGRAELLLGTAVVRLDEGTELSIARLDLYLVRFELRSGALSLHVRDWLEGETLEVVTPNSTVALDAAGEYRVDVRAEDSTTLIVHAGGAMLATASGPVRVAGGQRVRLEAEVAVATLAAIPPADAFDEWVLERELQLAQAEPFPVDSAEYEALERYGAWYDVATYGRVWSPYYTGYWTPFHNRHWRHDGFGWSWVIASSWGSFTFQGGDWMFLDNFRRWCWVPRPVPHAGSFAQDTRPFGRARVATGSHGLGQDGRAAFQHRDTARGRTSGGTIFRSFGGGQRSQPGTTTGGRSVATMRPSGSSATRTRSSSNPTRGSSSVFAVPSGG
jgi:hypothetical protein